MTPARLIGGAAAAAVAALLALNAVYVVHQTQQAVVLRFGQPVRVVATPGLHAKWPVAETAVRFDIRARPVEIDQAEVTTADHVRLIADGYLLYRVADAQQFYRTLGDARAAETRLRDMATAALARTPDVASPQASAQTGMGAALTDLRQRAAKARLGVELIDLRLRHAEPPAAEAETVYRRMRANGAELSAQIRADGEQRRTAIIADADRQVATQRGEAEGEALKIRGEGDAKRIAVLGEAYGRDPAFARFFRQMEGYQNALAQGDTTLILSPDNAFLHDFSKGVVGK